MTSIFLLFILLVILNNAGEALRVLGSRFWGVHIERNKDPQVTGLRVFLSLRRSAGAEPNSISDLGSRLAGARRGQHKRVKKPQVEVPALPAVTNTFPKPRTQNARRDPASLNCAPKLGRINTARSQGPDSGIPPGSGPSAWPGASSCSSGPRRRRGRP